MKTNKIIVLTLGLLCAASCDKVIEFRGNYDGEKIVMYSNINPGDPNVRVELRKSKFFLSRDYSSSIHDGLKDAVVSGSVNGIPLTFTEDNSSSTDGVFVAPYALKAGDEIAIEASHSGFKSVKAHTTIPQKVDFKVNQASYDHDTAELQITLTIYDNPSTTDYYRITVFREIKVGDVYTTEPLSLFSNDIMFVDLNGLSMLSQILGEDIASADTVFEDVLLGSDTRTVKVLAYIQDNMPIKATDGIKVELHSYSEELFKYSRSIENASDNDMTGFFNEGVSIFSNIEGGIGCVAAINTTRVDVTPTPEVEEIYSY